MFKKNLVLGGAIIFSLFYASFSYAGPWICDSDLQGISDQHAQGRVVVTREEDSDCDFGYRMEFEFPREGYMCTPSTVSNLPDGWVVTAEQTGPTNSREVTASRICEGAQDWAYIEQPRDSGTTDVCISSPIPSGFIVSRTPLTTPRDCFDRMEIRRPNASTSISTKCFLPNHPAPDGYVIRDVRLDADCEFNNSTHYREGISLPRESGITVVCEGTRVPAGFAYTASRSISSCGPRQGFELRAVTGDVSQMCSDGSHIPEGYIITGLDFTSNQCVFPYVDMEVSRPSTTGVTQGCRGNNLGFIVPDGFVVTAFDGSSMACGGNDTYEIRIPSESGQMICDGSPIPSGWGITEFLTSSECAAIGSGDAMMIRPFTGGSGFYYAICEGSPIPPGYVKTRAISSSNCPGGDAWFITIPDDTPGTLTTVCDSLVSDVPEGFVINEKDQYTDCSYPTGQDFGFRITRPRDTGQTRSCNASFFGDDALVPSGFVVVDQGLYDECSSSFDPFPGVMLSLPSSSGPTPVCSVNDVPEGYIIINEVGSNCTMIIDQPSATGETFACTSSTVPPGYVITERVNSSVCTLDAGMMIALPDPNSPTVVCDGSPIPTGFVRSTYGERDYAQCDNGPGFIVIPDGSGGGVGIVPTPFINTEADVVSKPADPTVTCSVGTVDGGLIGSAPQNSAGCN